MRVVVTDLGLGNLRSVSRALARAGDDVGRVVDVVVSADPDVVRASDAVVVPGQGGFGVCARALDSDLGHAVREVVTEGKPYLGICLGLQALFATSEEAAGARGLALFEGEVTRLVAPGEKIPHIGWNVVEPTSTRGLLPAEPTYFYFVHSYVVRPREDVVAGFTVHGERFVAAVAKDNVFACQFHPEKSQRAGLALLGRFLRT